MKTIHLLTENDSPVREKLAAAGFHAVSHGIAASSSPLTFREGDLVIHALSGKTKEQVRRCVSLNRKSAHMCLCDGPVDTFRDFLFAEGIADAVEFSDPAKITLAVSAIMNAPSPRTGATILLCDSRENSSAMISATASRFGYAAVTVRSVPEFFKNITEEKHELLLVNLGNHAFDPGDFIRRCHASTGIRRTPLIAFRSLRDGIFVNELLTGLNRYCSYILSPEELCSFLLDILSRKEIARLITSLESEALFSSYAHYAASTLGQIYLAEKKDILSLPDLTGGERTEGLCGTIRSLEECMARISTLRWMKRGNEGKNTVTCGVCG